MTAQPRRPISMIARCVAVALLVLGLAACTHPTAYGPALDGHGYTHRSYDADRITVSFSGNQVTPRETVETYMLYRAAEITLARGYDYFVVSNKSTERSTTYHTTYDYADPFGFHSALSYRYGWYDSPHTRYHPFFQDRFAGSSTYPEHRYTAHADIAMAKGARPEDNADAYDARNLINHLAPRIAKRP